MIDNEVIKRPGKCCICNQDKTIHRLYKNVPKQDKFCPGLATFHICDHCDESKIDEIIRKQFKVIDDSRSSD